MPIFRAIPAYKNDNLESQTSVSTDLRSVVSQRRQINVVTWSSKSWWPAGGERLFAIAACTKTNRWYHCHINSLWSP